MCGRLTLVAGPDELGAHFGLDKPPALAARYNIAPSQLVAVVAPKADPTKRGLALLKWGLVPSWSNDGKPGPINARAETVAGLPTFADSFRHKRCIIPATGFYEWRKDGAKKVPQQFRLASGGPMGFAGLWGVWTATDQKKLITCCIITTTANDVVRPCHARTPAVLTPNDYASWFDADAPLKDLRALLCFDDLTYTDLHLRAVTRSRFPRDRAITPARFSPPRRGRR